MSDGITSDEYYRIVQFYFNEAKLLDEEKYDSWLQLLTEDFIYVVPVKEIRGKNRDSYFSSDNFYFKDDRKGLEDRIRRLQHKEGWSSKMHTQTRRFISNVIPSHDYASGKLEVECNLLLARTEPDIVDNLTLTARRVDTLVESSDGLRISSRKIYLDQTSVVIYNMYFPI